MQRLALAVLTVLVLAATTAHAQIVTPITPRGGTRVATLTDILINQLHATTADQQAFIKRVVQENSANRLDSRLVLAVMQYAIQKDSNYPFPYFEQALRFEAAKRRVFLPPVALIANSKYPRFR